MARKKKSENTKNPRLNIFGLIGSTKEEVRKTSPEEMTKFVDFAAEEVLAYIYNNNYESVLKNKNTLSKLIDSSIRNVPSRYYVKGKEKPTEDDAVGSIDKVLELVLEKSKRPRVVV